MFDILSNYNVGHLKSEVLDWLEKYMQHDTKAVILELSDLIRTKSKYILNRI